VLSQANDTNTTKEQDRCDAQGVQIASLEQMIKTLTDEIAEVRAHFEQNHTDMQLFIEDRQTKNQEYQKTIADQMMTIAVSKEALSSYCSPTPSAGTNCTRTSSSTSPSTSGTPNMDNMPTAGESHLFAVAHFYTDTLYSPRGLPTS
jgi:hypothetical protein